ncbi:MAG: Asp23/Gls24 family envelope stress response protein [Bacillota bacterium]|nr:Asp23/Gls24 family envelope stress response protein [Bacillota bacterium]
MPVRKRNALGQIIYSDEALANLAGIIAMECYGLVGMASKRATDGLVELLKRENLSKGVKIRWDGEEVIIELYVVVEYGVSISAVASNIIENVKYQMENLTGLRVNRVDVTVHGIRV